MSADNSFEKMPLTTHLTELRQRLLYSLAAFVVFFIGFYVISDHVYGFLVQPLLDAGGHDRRMIYTSLPEAFFTYLKLSAFAAAMITIPVFLWQLWLFITPGLYSHEKKLVSPILWASPLLFYLGAAIAYYGVFPLAWQYFLSFETSAGPGGIHIALEARVSDYLSLVMSMVMAFGISFQMPIILLLLAKIGVIGPAGLRQKRRMMIVIIFIVAAILTPPDIVSQCLLAAPLLLLYELSIFLVAHAVQKQELEINAGS